MPVANFRNKEGVDFIIDSTGQTEFVGAKFLDPELLVNGDLSLLNPSNDILYSLQNVLTNQSLFIGDSKNVFPNSFSLEKIISLKSDTDLISSLESNETYLINRANNNPFYRASLTGFKVFGDFQFFIIPRNHNDIRLNKSLIYPNFVDRSRFRADFETGYFQSRDVVDLNNIFLLNSISSVSPNLTPNGKKGTIENSIYRNIECESSTDKLIELEIKNSFIETFSSQSNLTSSLNPLFSISNCLIPPSTTITIDNGGVVTSYNSVEEAQNANPSQNLIGCQEGIINWVSDQNKGFLAQSRDSELYYKIEYNSEIVRPSINEWILDESSTWTTISGSPVWTIDGRLTGDCVIETTINLGSLGLKNPVLWMAGITDQDSNKASSNTSLVTSPSIFNFEIEDPDNIGVFVPLQWNRAWGKDDTGQWSGQDSFNPTTLVEQIFSGLIKIRITNVSGSNLPDTGIFGGFLAPNSDYNYITVSSLLNLAPDQNSIITIDSVNYNTQSDGFTEFIEVSQGINNILISSSDGQTQSQQVNINTNYSFFEFQFEGQTTVNNNPDNDVNFLRWHKVNGGSISTLPSCFKVIDPYSTSCNNIEITNSYSSFLPILGGDQISFYFNSIDPITAYDFNNLRIALILKGEVLTEFTESNYNLFQDGSVGEYRIYGNITFPCLDVDYYNLCIYDNSSDEVIWLSNNLLYYAYHNFRRDTRVIEFRNNKNSRLVNYEGLPLFNQKFRISSKLLTPEISTDAAISRNLNRQPIIVNSVKQRYFTLYTDLWDDEDHYALNEAVYSTGLLTLDNIDYAVTDQSEYIINELEEDQDQNDQRKTGEIKLLDKSFTDFTTNC